MLLNGTVNRYKIYVYFLIISAGDIVVEMVYQVDQIDEWCLVISY